MVERTFELPDLGEGIAEGELVAWLVSPGDEVEQDETIAEVETDKALVEIPSAYDGVVTALHAEEGEVVPVGTTIVTFEVEADGTAQAAPDGPAVPDDTADEAPTERAPDASEDGEAAVPSGRTFAPPRVRRLARERGVDIAAVAGSGPGGRVTESDVLAAAESGGTAESGATTAESAELETAPEPAASDQPQSVDSTDESKPVGSTGGTRRERTLAMPATRRLATEAGVDIDEVPTDETREGLPFVSPAALDAYVEGREHGEPADETDEPEATAAGAERTGPSAGERIPYTGIRRTIGERMAKSKYTAPHVSHHDDVDAERLVELREELAEVAAEDDVKLTYLPFVVKAVTAALQEYPELNSSLDEEAEEILLHDEYNIGIATATDSGLMVPVVKHADEKGLAQLAEEIQDLATRARDRSITREEMQGGTFTITNVGVLGGKYMSPIINYPEAAILAMGTIEKRPRVVDDEVVPRQTMSLSMSVDHRLVDGAEAAMFTNRVKEYVREPARLLLE